jgi:Fic family protein
MTNLNQFQPLYPESRVLAPLQELASEIIAQCHHLHGQAGESIVRSLRPKLRAMNSYYTNKIEGQHTLPKNIERALKKDFDADKELAKKQRLAIAHMEVEELLESNLKEGSLNDLFDHALVSKIHEELYSRLPEEDRITDEGKIIIPGEYRKEVVTAGRHLAPEYKSIDDFMRGWASHYRGLTGSEALVIGVACSHHRLAWMHPFIDGNGRTARLHSHLALHSRGLTQGLWSPMRGLARTQEDYYARLNNADMPRRNDLDGRGVLSQEELVKFAHYVLETCLDQVKFMQQQLNLDSLKVRLKDLLIHLQENPWQVGSEKSLVKTEALEALHYTAMTGPIERARFIAMTGLGRSGRRVLASLINYGVLSAESPRAPVTFTVPLSSLRFLFPRLWPEAEVDE